MKNPFRNIRVFWSEMTTEVKKASWPNRTELRDSTLVVIIGVAILGAFISIVDFSLFQVVALFTNLVTGS